jgi:hypothetical protein
MTYHHLPEAPGYAREGDSRTMTMARKSRSPGLTGGHAAFRQARKVRSLTQYAGEGAGRRTTSRGSRRIAKPARRTSRGTRTFATSMRLRDARGRFRRK